MKQSAWNDAAGLDPRCGRCSHRPVPWQPLWLGWHLSFIENHVDCLFRKKKLVPNFSRNEICTSELQWTKLALASSKSSFQDGHGYQQIDAQPWFPHYVLTGNHRISFKFTDWHNRDRKWICDQMTPKFGRLSGFVSQDKLDNSNCQDPPQRLMCLQKLLSGWYRHHKTAPGLHGRTLNIQRIMNQISLKSAAFIIDAYLRKCELSVDVSTASSGTFNAWTSPKAIGAQLSGV